LLHELKAEHCSTHEETIAYITKYLGDKYDTTKEITKEGERWTVWDRGCDSRICTDYMLDALDNFKKEKLIENFERKMSLYDIIEYCAKRLGSDAEKVLEGKK